MKKFTIVGILVGLLTLSTLSAQAATLTGIYDFRDAFGTTKTSFEGLDFTNDGTLWITSAPNGFFDPKRLIGVDLENESVLKDTNFNYQYTFNPVGLASDGTNLFLTNNLKGVGGLYADTGTIDGKVDFIKNSTLAATDCKEPEGAAYLNGFIYVSCEDTKNIVQIDPTTGQIVKKFDLGVNLLGLGATENQLIVGDYTNHSLLMYDVVQGKVTETINLADLFVGADSDYARLTGGTYSVGVSASDIRSIPDPDGIAYRNGKIYMTFEHDLRVYEITATPEPTTLLLLGIGLLGLAKWRKIAKK